MKKKTILQSILGIIFVVAGFYSGFLFAQKDVKNPQLLISAILVIVGITTLILAKKSFDKSNPQTNPSVPTEDYSKSGQALKGLVDKNNQIMSQWNKINETRDKLKLLKTSTNVNKN